MRDYSRHFSSLFALLGVLVSQSVAADWSVPGPANADQQNIVIVVSENPNSNPERTCLAITLGKTLANNPYRPQNVTIFATLDGTALGVKRVVKRRRFRCAQSDGSEISLQENLEQFLSVTDNDLVLCPICYGERYGDRLPDYGVLPGSQDGTPGTAVIDVLSNADKVIDF